MSELFHANRIHPGSSSETLHDRHQEELRKAARSTLEINLLFPKSCCRVSSRRPGTEGSLLFSVFSVSRVKWRYSSEFIHSTKDGKEDDFLQNHSIGLGSSIQPLLYPPSMVIRMYTLLPIFHHSVTPVLTKWLCNKTWQIQFVCQADVCRPTETCCFTGHLLSTLAQCDCLS